MNVFNRATTLIVVSQLLILFTIAYAVVCQSWLLVVFSLLSITFSIFCYWVFLRHLSVLSQKNAQAFNLSRRPKGLLRSFTALEEDQKDIINRFEITTKLVSNITENAAHAIAEQLPPNDPVRLASLKIKAQLEQSKLEEASRQWVAAGITIVNNELKHKGEQLEFCNRIISSVVKYLNANQGGLYLEFKDSAGQRYLNLVACYAYGKSKYAQAQIFEGQGVLGQCMLDHDFVFITDIPREFVKITSGLGEATPRNIVIAPLMYNNHFYGAIELASFDILQPHQVEFLKRISEDIASEMASLNYLNSTKQLLEQSNLLTKELQEREQAMKQNLEELASTQEEMARKQSELAGVLNAIDTTLATAEFGVDGKLIRCNEEFQNIFLLSSNDLKEKGFQHIIGSGESVKFGDILQGKKVSGDFCTVRSDGKQLWLSTTFTTILSPDGKPQKILALVQNITDKKIKEQEFERLSLVANNTDNAVLITDSNGITEYVNAGFTKMTGYRPEEIIGKKPGQVLQGEESDKKTIQKIREKLTEQKPIYEEILNFDKFGVGYWVSLVINPIFGESGELRKFISVQANITETKKSSLDLKYKLEAIGRSNAIIEFDTQGFILAANQNFLNIVGYELDEVIGQHHQMFLIDRNSSSTDYKEFWAKLKAGEFIKSEFPRRTKDGKTIWLRGIYNPIFDMNGKPKKIVKFAIDITEEKRLELLNSRRQRELSSYLEGINNTIASAEFDLNGLIVNANTNFLAIMGYTDAELMGKHVETIMKEDQASSMMWENLKIGKFFSGEFKMKAKTGQELWLTGTFNPIFVDDKIPEKIMMFAQFTTQEKEKVNELNGMVAAVKSTLPTCELTPKFACKSANEKFMKMFSLTRLDFKNKTIFDFLDPDFHKTWNTLHAEIIERGFCLLNLPFKKGSEIHYYETSVSLVRNLDSQVSRIIILLVKEISKDQPMLVAV